MVSKGKAGLWGMAATGALLAAGPAYAQTTSDSANESTPGGNQSQNSDQIEQVVVTATRRQEAMQSVPVTLTALSANELATARINGTTALAQMIPNVNITSEVGASKIFIRGVGQTVENPGQEPGVATYIDGVYQATPFSSALEFSDVQRIEVLKGPQGTLFGRNATGGLVNVITRDPAEIFGGDVSASVGNYRAVKLKGYGTGGLADGLAANVAVLYLDQHGFGTNLATGQDLAGSHTLALHSKIVYQPEKRTKITLAGMYTLNRGSAGNALAIEPGSAGVAGYTAPANFYDVNANFVPHNRNWTWQVSAQVEHEFDLFNFKSITSYLKSADIEFEDLDSTPLDIVDATFAQNTKAFTEELQLLSKEGSPLKWIIGTFYFHSRAEGTPTTRLAGGAFGPLRRDNFATLSTSSISVYGEATYEILPKTDLTLGARYTSDNKHFSGESDFVNATTGALASSSGLVRSGKRFGDVTYRAIGDYHLTDNVMFYVSYSTGFLSGGYDTSNPNGIAFQPEKIEAVEGGAKTEFFDHHFRLNVSGFHYNYNDLQLPVLVLTNGVAGQVTLNATNSTIYGADIDGQIVVSKNLSFNFGIGYLDTKYTKFPSAPCTRQVPVPNSNLMATALYSCDVSGKPLETAPKYSFNIGGQYSIPTAAGKFTLSANYFRTDKFYWDVVDRLAQPAYGLLNAQLSWTMPSNPVSIALYVENLTNHKYQIAAYPVPGFGDLYAAGKPRLFGVEVSSSF